MADTAQFTQGSTMRHVAVMTSASAVGLMTLFVVDLVDMYFLSLLGEIELAAAIGYAGSILFFTTSISIGIAITSGALVSKAIGQDDTLKARRYATNVLVYGILFAIIVSFVIWRYIPELLSILGARGRSLELASSYLYIIVPSMPVLVVAMAATGILRATADAKRSMWATVWGGLVNAVLDPILIFGLSMGIDGAAVASVIARITVMLVALNGVGRIHRLLRAFDLRDFMLDLPKIAKLSLPAILTNAATPIGNAYVITAIAKFGDSAVAGMSVVGRVIPVAFGIIFALSGAVGPIIGQNYGAQKFDRVNQTLKNAVVFCTVVVVSISMILFLIQNYIVYSFNLDGDAKQLVTFFCTWIGISFIFNGYQFVSNAAFNNLGYAHYATGFNITKATLGTIPFVYLGAQLYGAPGVLAGQAVGAVLTGLFAIWMGFKVVNRVQSKHWQSPPAKEKPFNPKIPLWPQTNTRG